MLAMCKYSPTLMKKTLAYSQLTRNLMQVLPQPLHCNCFGSSPETPHVWFDLSVFVAYAELALGDGVSSTGKCYGCKAATSS